MTILCRLPIIDDFRSNDDYLNLVPLHLLASNPYIIIGMVGYQGTEKKDYKTSNIFGKPYQVLSYLGTFIRTIAGWLALTFVIYVSP